MHDPKPSKSKSIPLAILSVVLITVIAFAVFNLSRNPTEIASAIAVQPPELPLNTRSAHDSPARQEAERSRRDLRVNAKQNRFGDEFTKVREEQFQIASAALSTAESLIVDFGSEDLNGSVKEYQELSWDFKMAVERDDLALIRELAIKQGAAYEKMVTKVAPLPENSRGRFNRYYFKIGEAWASLLMACAGADLPNAATPPVYPLGTEPSRN